MSDEARRRREILAELSEIGPCLPGSLVSHKGPAAARVATATTTRLASTAPTGPGPARWPARPSPGP